MIYQMKKRTGFTIIELLIVIVITAVIATIAIPNFMSWRTGMYVKAAARDLYSSIQETRMMAINTNSTLAIVFDTTNNRYYRCDDPGTDGNWDSVGDTTGTGDNNKIQTYDLSYQGRVQYSLGAVTGGTSVPGGVFPADGISYTTPNNVLTINSRGITTAAGYVYLENQAATRSYALGTTTSGRVKLWKWDGGNWK